MNFPSAGIYNDIPAVFFRMIYWSATLKQCHYFKRTIVPLVSRATGTCVTDSFAYLLEIKGCYLLLFGNE